jgi:hypothetical protein
VRAEIEQRREAALRWENQHAVEPAALEAIRRERSK